jgi:hypothetical protein
MLLTKRLRLPIRHSVSLGCLLGPVTKISSVSALWHWHTLCLSPSFHQAYLPSHIARLPALIATSSSAGVCGDEEKQSAANAADHGGDMMGSTIETVMMGNWGTRIIGERPTRSWTFP